MTKDDNLPAPSRETSDLREIPVRPVRDVAREARTDLGDSIDALKAWGVKIEEDSRLHQALSILEHAETTGVLAPLHRGDQLGLRALELAFDYSAIARTLPDEKIAAVRRELEQSTQGPLEPTDGGRGAVQLQSQFIVRAALVLANEIPIRPAKSKPGVSVPDLVLENGMTNYAVEVKRPEKAKNVVPRMVDARNQLNKSGMTGAILIDITDCVRGASNEQVDCEVSRLALRMYDLIFANERGHKRGYEGVMSAGTFARTAWTSVDQPDHAMVIVHMSSRIGVFSQRMNTLYGHRARWLRSACQVGLDRLNQTLGASRS